MTALWKATTVVVTLTVAAAVLRAQAPQVQTVGVALPPRDGRDVLIRACNRCHIVTAVLARQRDRTEWAAVVDNMRKRGAPATDADAAVIVEYLATHFSPGSATPLPGGGRGGRLFLLAGRVPEVETVVGRPLETRDPIGAGQQPAFLEQTRARYVRTASTVAATVVAKGLRHPWSLALLPDGRMLVTEKPGAMRMVTMAGVVGPEIAGVPRVHFGIDAGLLDVVLDPAFATNRLIYFTYVEPREGGVGTTLARARLNQHGTTLEDTRRVAPHRADEARWHPFRFAFALRSSRQAADDHGRTRGPHDSASRAAARLAAREGPAAEPGRNGCTGQSVHPRRPARSRTSGRTGCATRRGSRCIPSRARSGPSITVKLLVTKSTSSARAATTGGPSLRTVRSTTCGPSMGAAPRRPGWNSQRTTGIQPSVPPVSRSIAAA